MPLQINHDMIARLEGRAINRAYVPNPRTSKSGATVATGVDLGQMEESELSSLSIPATLKAKLAPYTGFIKQDAVNFLAKNPLTLTDAEVTALDHAIINRELAEIVAKYNREVGVGAFENLNGFKQTVIFSVYYQYGDLARRAPRFWKQITTGDWEGAYRNLKDFGDAYDARHEIEAAYLKQGM